MSVALMRFMFYVSIVFILGGITPVVGASRSDKPDFDDYRKIGDVVEKYSRSKESARYGVMLRVRRDSIPSLADGRVVSSGMLRGYGRYLIVDHGNGWHSLYSHLARIEVKKGSTVTKGDIIGLARHKRLFLVVSYKGNPINPSEVMSAVISFGKFFAGVMV